MSCFTACFRQRTSPPTRQTVDIDEEVSGSANTKLYSYKELQIATQNFSPANKIGEGGFGSVYKGRLKDGNLAAIKVLSAESKQGAKEFLTEIVVISSVEHENLVKLYGCCAEEDKRILVYEYLENGSLAHTLLGGGLKRIDFSWKVCAKICIGVARGLAYLHEEVRPYIVHRDIKASNILLDKDLVPKISDFGLAKLFPENLTHISTHVAGTFGYLAPEYAVRAQLTRKADIYSYGILLLEIVSGRPNRNKQLPAEETYLLERVWSLYEKGQLVQVVDIALGGECIATEACRYLKIGLLCAQYLPKLRPSMSTVVKMLTGLVNVDDYTISKPGILSELDAVKNPESITSFTSPGAGSREQSAHNTFTFPTMTNTSIHARD